MFNNLKSIFVIIALCLSLPLSAEEKNAEPAPEIVPKLIKLTAKKLCNTRKIRSKEEFPNTEGGIDYHHDDKTDTVTVTVNIENKNKTSLQNYKIVAVVYGKSVTEKRADPEVYKEFVEEIKVLKSREKYKKEFSCIMTYDKSDDTYEEEPEEEGGDTKRTTTKAFGSDFYGYKLDLLNEKGEVVVSSVWPGGLAKVLKKAEEKNKKAQK